MQTAGQHGLFGAVATAVTTSLALRARRNGRRRAQQEEDACLCASHLHALGDALHAYRQDHAGELPRQFICPPHDQRLAGGWSADWNAASLADYITDADVYLCPSRGAAYSDRVPSLLRDGPRQLMRPDPQSVVLYCRHHAKWGGNDRWGEYIVLRLDGSVERISTSMVEFWRYGDGRWYSPDEEASDGANIFPVFPGEPWPPRLEVVSNRPWWPGDREMAS